VYQGSLPILFVVSIYVSTNQSKIFEPKQGHLLVLEGAQLKLDHGLMEFEYTTNYHEEVSQHSLQPSDAMAFSEANTSMLEPHKAFGVAMTATIDTSGRLLLGTSCSQSLW
jgi:hypothetical protein